MKKISILFVIGLGLALFSCKSDDDQTLLADDGTIGVERFAIDLTTQTLADLRNAPVSGTLGQPNTIGIQGYVMPSFAATTQVFLTIKNPNSDDIAFSHNGQGVAAGSEFRLTGLFEQGSFTSVQYIPSSGTEANFDLVFRNSLGSVITIPFSSVLSPP